MNEWELDKWNTLKFSQTEIRNAKFRNFFVNGKRPLDYVCVPSTNVQLTTASTFQKYISKRLKLTFTAIFKKDSFFFIFIIVTLFICVILYYSSLKFTEKLL